MSGVRCALLVSVALAALSGCAVRISDTSFIRPVVAGTLDINAAKSALPSGYSVNTDFIATPDGEKLYRARFTHLDARSTVVFFNGNLSTVEKHAVSTATKLSKDWQPNFVFVDYRGYGQSSGKASLETLQADSLLVFDAEASLARAGNRKVVLAGYSIGGVVAGGVLESRRPDSVLLLATVTDVADMIAQTMPAYTKLFFRVSVDPRLNAIDNRRALSRYSGPLLVVGAEHDSQTPAALSTALFNASATASSEKKLVIAKGVGHSDVLDAPEFRDALKAFAAKYGL